MLQNQSVNAKAGGLSHCLPRVAPLGRLTRGHKPLPTTTTPEGCTIPQSANSRQHVVTSLRDVTNAKKRKAPRKSNTAQAVLCLWPRASARTIQRVISKYQKLASRGSGEHCGKENIDIMVKKARVTSQATPPSI